MPVDLRNRSFVKELDFTTEELRFLIDLSAELKRAKRDGTEVATPRGQEHRPDLREGHPRAPAARSRSPPTTRAPT